MAKKKIKKDERRQAWIEDTQMFQRIAGVPETNAEILGREWDNASEERKDFNSKDIKRHREIQDAALK